MFQKYPNVGNDHHVTEFITDYLRMMVSGNLNAHEIESLMDSEIDTHHQEEHAAVAAIARLAGALPAFGIVAAVLGVVNTMGSVGQPPAVLGGMIGSALVGTFLGILLAYGWWSRWAACWSRRWRTPARNCSASRPRCWPACRATRRRWPSSSAARCCSRPTAPASPSWKPREGQEVSHERADVELPMAGDAKKLQPIIIKRVKKGGHAVHGGAWKIAYADFVTAMMAFFLLMWLLGSTTEGDKKGIADYFQPR
jgi:hypothetical protein